MLWPIDFLLWFSTIPLSALITTVLAVVAMSTAISTPERPAPTMRTVFCTNWSSEGLEYWLLWHWKPSNLHNISIFPWSEYLIDFTLMQFPGLLAWTPWPQ